MRTVASLQGKSKAVVTWVTVTNVYTRVLVDRLTPNRKAFSGNARKLVYKQV